MPNDRATISWVGYDFSVYPIEGTPWYDVAGVYIFAASRPDGSWYPVYIGETESFARRLYHHERQPEAVRHGATTVHTRVVLSQIERRALERHLISIFQPLLNA